MMLLQKKRYIEIFSAIAATLPSIVNPPTPAAIIAANMPRIVICSDLTFEISFSCLEICWDSVVNFKIALVCSDYALSILSFNFDASLLNSFLK